MAKSDVLRLFVAIYPPPEQAMALRAVAAPLIRPVDRLVPVEQVHLTLVFLGPVARREVKGVLESMGRARVGVSGTGGLAMRPRGLVRLPQRGPARVLAATTDLPSGLAEVQKRLAQRLTLPRRGSKTETFLPHLTLARFDQQSTPPTDPLPGLPEAIVRSPIVPEHMCLMRSVQTSAGTRHEELGRVPLALPRH